MMRDVCVDRAVLVALFVCCVRRENFLTLCKNESAPSADESTASFQDFDSFNETTMEMSTATPQNVFVDVHSFGGLMVEKEDKKVTWLTNATQTIRSRGAQGQKLNPTPAGTTFRVAAIVEPPFINYVNLSDEARREQKIGPGIIMDILVALQKIHKFDYELIQPEDSVWGEPTGPDEENWTGVFGMLQRGEVELIAAPTVVRYDRHAVADYTYPFHTSETGMLIRSPDRYLDNRFLIVTAPFKWEVWAMTALAIVVSGGIMKAFSRALQTASEIDYTVWDATWIFFSVFVQQGLPTQPRSWTCRTLLAFWWLAALTLVATFTGNMVALFAVNRSYLPFNTQEEMLEYVRAGYKVIMTNGSLTRLKFIQNSEQDFYRRLWHEMSAKGKWINVSTYEEGVELVKQRPNMVLLGPRETLQVYTARDCNVTITNGGLIPVMYSIALKKRSNFTCLFSHEIRDLVEMGFVTKWLKDYEYQISTERGTRCSSGEGVTNAGDAIDIIRAQGAFWILLAGVALAAFGFFLEFALRLVKKFVSSARKFILSGDGKKFDSPGQNGTYEQSELEHSRDSKYYQNYGMDESIRSYQPHRIVLPTGEDESVAHELKLRRNNVAVLRF